MFNFRVVVFLLNECFVRLAARSDEISIHCRISATCETIDKPKKSNREHRDRGWTEDVFLTMKGQETGVAKESRCRGRYRKNFVANFVVSFVESLDVQKSSNQELEDSNQTIARSIKTRL